MLARKRVRRANPVDLYRHCKATGGDCPPDVINKIEQTTPADNILKWGSTGVYFGGLGIGTGRGGGGTTLGGVAGAGRPSLPRGTLGPVDILPIPYERPFGGFGSDLVPVRPFDPIGSGTAEPPLVEIELQPLDPVRPAAPGPTYPVEPDLTAPTDIPTLINGSTEVTTVPTTVDAGVSDTAIIEMPSLPGGDPPPGPEVISRTQYNNPVFEVELGSNIPSGETSSADHIIVGAEGSGSYIGEPEELIPLLDFGSRDTDIIAPGEQETAFTTSTPERVPIRDRLPIRPYGRQYQQVRVTDPEFLEEPTVLISARNPAFERDVTLIFEEDLEDIARGNLDFEGIRRLSRPYMQRRPTGIRVSRIGQRQGTIRTRSGVEVGSATHFYTDISPITRLEPGEAIELNVLGEQTGEATVIRGDTSTGIEVDLTAVGENRDNALQEELLEEDNEEQQVGEQLQLVFSTLGDEAQDVFVVPVTNGADIPPTFIYNDDGTHIIYPGSTEDEVPLIPADPDITPYIVVDLYSGSLDYDLHPSLLRRRKRKRKRVYL
ncbi:L2 protein [Eumops bonariensis papillomavirus type 1]|nr:L2 protein [Eumops bonariensis papillomavirus type 1]